MASFFLERRSKEKKLILDSIGNSVNTLVFGTQGTGKTTLIRSIVNEYCDSIGNGIYIDCLIYQTANAILREILFSIGTLIASKSNYDLAKRLKERSRKLKLAIFLDHSDNLRDHEILKFLFGFGIPVCLVSTGVNASRRLDSLLRTRIPNIVNLKTLSKEEVLQILLERAETIDLEILEEIAEKVNGNITLAVNLFEGVRARNGDKSLITNFFTYQNVLEEPFSEDCKMIMNILSQKKRLPAGELFKLYHETSDFPKSERSFRKYMEALRNRNLVRPIGNKKGRIYEIVENAKAEGDP